MKLAAVCGRLVRCCRWQEEWPLGGVHVHTVCLLGSGLLPMDGAGIAFDMFNFLIRCRFLFLHSYLDVW